MKIRLEEMESVKLDIDREIVIQRYHDGLLIMNTFTNKQKHIKYGDLGEEFINYERRFRPGCYPEAEPNSRPLGATPCRSRPSR